jgi:hypothetical protein
VPLDISVEIPHALSVEEAARRVERAAMDLARSWARWNVTTERSPAGELRVKGHKGEARFEATLVTAAGRVVVKVAGALELSMLEIAFARGESGVRDRVRKEVTKIVSTSLEAP